VRWKCVVVVVVVVVEMDERWREMGDDGVVVVSLHIQLSGSLIYILPTTTMMMKKKEY